MCGSAFVAVGCFRWGLGARSGTLDSCSTVDWMQLGNVNPRTHVLFDWIPNHLFLLEKSLQIRYETVPILAWMPH